MDNQTNTSAGSAGQTALDTLAERQNVPGVLVIGVDGLPGEQPPGDALSRGDPAVNEHTPGKINRAPDPGGYVPGAWKILQTRQTAEGG